MPKELTTWAGSTVPAVAWPKVLLGWQRHARRLERQLKRLQSPRRPATNTLEWELCEILSKHCGERTSTWLNNSGGEGAVDTLCRIISERDRAMTVLALDRLKGS